jgi:hypothetical protein
MIKYVVRSTKYEEYATHWHDEYFAPYFVLRTSYS